MENDLNFVFASFCDQDKILKYFVEFHDFLQTTEKVVELNKINTFLKCVRVFEREDLFDSLTCTSNDISERFSKNLNDVLLQILEIFCLKHLKVVLGVQDDYENHTERAIAMDTIAYLIKKYLEVVRDRGFIKIVIDSLCMFFKNVEDKLENYTNISESEIAPLFYTSLKFVAKVFQCIPVSNSSDYLSENSILTFVENLPFTDTTTVKTFVNHIFPAVIKFSNEPFKDQLFKCIWRIVCVQFNDINHTEISESNSNIYTLFCCLSEYIFSIRVLNFWIHDELIFWRIILSGLTCSFPFTRKKSLNVFKMLLSWVNHGGCLNEVTGPVQTQYSAKLKENMKTWNDVVIVFESLEEKQIHVIKPVLPKFTRILQLTKKGKAALSGDTFDLPSSWIMALLSRMLKHETRFVVKWALSTVLTLDFKDYIFHHHYSEMLIKILLEAFNEQTMYSRNNEQDNYSLFLSSEKISLFLKNFIATLESPSIKVGFMKCLISTIASQSWCGVALLHVTFALSELDCFPAWNQDCLTHIRKIVLDCQRNQEPVFRTALEYFLLECCTLFLDWEDLNCEQLAELLIIFKSTIVLRHSRPWKRLSAKLQENISKDVNSPLSFSKATDFCIESIKKIQEVIVSEGSGADIDELEIEKVAKILIMLADSGVISHLNMAEGLNWKTLLNPVITTLQCASKRPYMNIKSFLSCVKLLSHLIIESNGCQQIEDIHSSNILQCIQNCSDMIEFMYQKLFTDFESNSYISQNNIIFGAFYILTAESRLKGLFINLIPVLIKNIQDLLNDTQRRRYLLFPLWKILNTLVLDAYPAAQNSEMCLVHQLNYKVILKTVNENLLLECLSKPTFIEKIEKEQWLKYSYKAVCYFWDVCSVAIQHFDESELSSVTLLLAEEAQKIFNNGPKIAVPHAISCMKFLVPKLGMQDLNVMSDLLDASWIACLELRGNESFRPALISLIEVIFQTEMLRDVFCNTLHKYVDRFKELSENTIGIFYNFIKQFCSSFTITSLMHSKFDCVSVFVHALTFGPNHQKTHKIMEETLMYLIERDSDFANSLTLFENNKPSCYVRILIINYLLKNLTNENEELSFEIIKQLLKVEIDDDGKQFSHFANSLSHRIRNRAWQGILLLQNNITREDLNEELLTQTLNTLGSENQQPSIRYMQEWLIFKIVKTHSSLLNKYPSLFEQTLEKRPSYIISVLSVTNLLILNKILTKEVEIMRYFKLITVLCMAQNFTVRLYAQMALTNLFSLCQQKNLGSAILQYEFVLQLIEMQKCLAGQGNFFKNVMKLSNDFCFSCFKPDTHFTLETIFYELPRLSNLSPDEMIKPSLFSEDDFKVPIYNVDNVLKNCTPTSWSYKSGNETPATEEGSLDFNFQKKIMPIKEMLNDFEGLELVNNTGKKPCKEGLIVVASLIDRIPNLGGLCRTCEVFAVSEFVIGNLRYTEDKTFQTLAVSADKWVSIKEVKPHLLKEYLVSMKEQGYALIGAEQTEDSSTLSEYKFPKKSVLLLGHEKQGLPVDLIQLLDVCVEIPQQGVVRSLNVHVSGAILIWEYARQHMKSS